MSTDELERLEKRKRETIVARKRHNDSADPKDMRNTPTAFEVGYNNGKESVQYGGLANYLKAMSAFGWTPRTTYKTKKAQKDYDDGYKYGVYEETEMRKI